jgi:hypothetical protein
MTQAKDHAEQPVRVQLSRKKGWRMPPNTVSVARPTKWGNPFPIRQSRRFIPLEAGYSREQAVDAFRTLVTSYDEPTWQPLIHELRGKNLACWCKLDAPCHADVLLELANKEDGARLLLNREGRDV